MGIRLATESENINAPRSAYSSALHTRAVVIVVSVTVIICIPALAKLNY